MSINPVFWNSQSEESPMISTERSIIDEIRDDLQLDNYYRRFEKNQLLNGLDFCDDFIETDYVFESYYD
jgi:hypothetical protein|tara:strand:+ start:1463 stop:1669 length:207 start_codon:yes stop_codon:yes gene_type:complete